MDVLFVAVSVVGVVILLAWVLSYRASRIDRLHARIEGCWHALDAVMVRRSEALLELANSGTLDPASSLLLSYTVGEVLETGGTDRATRIDAENQLAATATLLIAESSPRALAEVDLPLRTTIEQTARQVKVAEAFYNESVASVIAIRDQLVTKIACLAGKAPRLQPIEVVDVDVDPLLAAPLVDDERRSPF